MGKLILTIAVLFSPADGPLTQQSAQELTWYLQQLYQCEVVCMADGDASKSDAAAVIAIGSAADAIGQPIELDALERHVLIQKANGRTEVLLRGGSALATRAAVFRFLEHCGVLFGPLEDFMPDQKQSPQWKPIEIRERAARPIFGPHYWINFPMDPSAFTRDQWLRMVQGWSRMGATTMGYHFYQGFPWYDVDMRGFKDQSGYFFYGQRHPMPDEPELNYAVKNDKTFVSPDVEAFAEDTPRVHAWAQETVRQSMAAAHKLGMKNSVTFEPFGYDIPWPYKIKMKEWNDGNEVQITDRLHPLMQEYVVSAIRSILKTYPDIDILKLVSGEGAKHHAPEAEHIAKIKELVGGPLTDAKGGEIELPTGDALAILTDALTSCKLSYMAVKEARQQGMITDDLQVAIGCYPGSNFEVHPALFALIGKIVPDKDIKIHFLPAHGMGRSAEALQLIQEGTFDGRTLEISGWTEMDGWMYVPQSCLKETQNMNETIGTLPADALYAIQWRVAGTTFDNAYFCRSQWDDSLTPEEFWRSLNPLFDEKGTELMQEGMSELEQHKSIAFGFCFYGCWGPMLPHERDGNTNLPFGDPAGPAGKIKKFNEIAHVFEKAAETADSHDGRRLANYFANKSECAAIHCDFWRLVCEASQAAITAYEENHDPNAIKALAVPYAHRMQRVSEDYLKHYQKVMFDRTDEGMLSSYYNTATRYAYRYAHPDEDDATGKFYSGAPAGRKQTEAKYPEQIRIISPDIVD